MKTDEQKAGECIAAFRPLFDLNGREYPVYEGKEYRRAELGIDGNAGFALLGLDLQQGEAEFVVVEQDNDELLSRAQRRAASQALANLRKRLNMPYLSYYIGSSHPGYC